MIPFQGYIPSGDDELDQVSELVAPYQAGVEFADAAPHLAESGRGKLSLPFRCVLELADRDVFREEAQTTGDCTSHGARNAADISRAAEIVIHGEPESWEARGATEGIYGYRGFRGQGMSPARATQFLHRYGVLLRKRYPFADLSRYNSGIGTRWGGSGPPNELLDVADDHPCKYFARIRSPEEARDALTNGYGLHVGSQHGFSSRRDDRGFADRRGNWNHDMCVGACDDTGRDAAFLIINSWGEWNGGGHPEWGPIPGGSFLVTASTLGRMIREGECWAVGDVTGWPAKDLPDYGFGSFM